MIIISARNWQQLLFSCLFLISLTFNANADVASHEVGKQLFFGKKPLIGKIVSQDFDLPIEASRCVNCHISDQQSQPSEFVKKTQTFGPPLNYQTLTDVKNIHGGPAFSYTATGFCTLLRTGIDPTQIVSKRSMPRYEISDEACNAIWMYLMSIKNTD